MTESIAESSSPRLKARLAGFLYLIIMIAAGFAIFVRESLIVRGDAAATAHNILAHESLFRLAAAADLAADPCYIGLTLILYELLKPVSRSFSLLAAFMSLVGCAVGAVVTLNHLAVVVLLDGAPYLSVFTTEQLQALALTFLRLHALGYYIAVVFFGVYLLLLGCLIVGSTFLPRLLGMLLAIEGVVGLINCFTNFLLPTLAAKIFPVVLATGLAGEGSLTLWLLFVGVNAAKWREQAGAA